MEHLRKFLLSAFLSFVVAASGVFILYSPDTLAEEWGFKPIRNNSFLFHDIPTRTCIGLTTLLFTAAFITLTVIATWKWISHAWAIRTAKERILKTIDSLAPDQYMLLRYFVYGRQQTVTIHSLSDAMNAASALVSVGILRRGQGETIVMTPFSIPDFVWEHLQQNPHVVFFDQNLDDPKVLHAMQAYHREIKHGL